MGKEIREIEELGYDDFFDSSRVELGLEDFGVARVIAQQKGSYRVKNVNGEYRARITGKQRFAARSKEDYPVVGDWVAVSLIDEENVLVRGILPRKTILKRKSGDKDRIGEKTETQIIATNIDTAFIVEAVDRDYSLNRLERYLTIARDGGVKPAVILNKIDLISKEELNQRVMEIKNRLGEIPVILTSTKTGQGLDELESHIEKGKTYCFLGSSGVGKSTLINKLLGEEIIKTGDIGSHSGRGKHVTTSREMYFLARGGMVIDNPGVREVGMTDATLGIDNLFDEITTLAKNCKFIDCTHTHEPDCAVLASLGAGFLDENKYSNYMNLKKEAEHYEASKIEKREKVRQFGKFINKAKKELRKAGHKDF